MNKSTRTTFEPLNESTFAKVLKEGDLIEFRPRQSFKILYTSCLNGGNENSVHEVVDRKVQSHWGVFVGSSKIVHVACSSMPYCIREPGDIPASYQRMSLQTEVYPTQEEADNTKDKLMKFSDLKTCVRKDLLFEVAEAQKAEPYLNNKMDAEFIAGTSDEIVNTALFLVDKDLPHDFITKDCKDFAIFCRYGETQLGLEQIKQRHVSRNKTILCGGMLGMLSMMAVMFCKAFSAQR